MTLEFWLPLIIAVFTSAATSYLTVYGMIIRNTINVDNLNKRLDKLESECCGDNKHVADRLTQVETTVAHVKESVREGFETLRHDIKSITQEIHTINKNFKHERVT